MVNHLAPAGKTLQGNQEKEGHGRHGSPVAVAAAAELEVVVAGIEVGGELDQQQTDQGEAAIVHAQGHGGTLPGRIEGPQRQQTGQQGDGIDGQIGRAAEGQQGRDVDTLHQGTGQRRIRRQAGFVVAAAELRLLRQAGWPIRTLPRDGLAAGELRILRHPCGPDDWPQSYPPCRHYVGQM